MKFCVLFVLLFCAHSSYQQTTRPNNNQLHALAYAESDFNQPTTSTVAPESTTKKRGFFGGIKDFFSGKGKDETTTEAITTSSTTTSSTTTSSTTTTKTTVATSSPSTPKTQTNAPITPQSTPKVLPQTDRTTTTTSIRTSVIPSTSPQPPKNDDFPPLSGHHLPHTPARRPATTTPPNAWGRPATTAAPSPPNAWGKPPGVPAISGSTPPPASFFPNNKRPQNPSQPALPNVSSGPVTDAELLTLSESLFSKDINNPFKYVTVNYQGRTYSSATTDEASQPFLNINDGKLLTLSTVEKMKAMYNNYEQDAFVNEYVSPVERKEEDDFIEAVMATAVMRHAMSFLTQKGVVTTDSQTQRELLKTIWFNLYSRGMGKIGSSGFEHVFLSEVKNGSVMGLHNWIYMSEAEKKGDLDYKGWTKKIDLGNKGQIAKVRFTLNNHIKPTNSLFIGTSPELEIALYTVCFELRADKECRLAYGGKDFNIVTHSYRYRGKNLIGSAYPEI